MTDKSPARSVSAEGRHLGDGSQGHRNRNDKTPKWTELPGSQTSPAPPTPAKPICTANLKAGKRACQESNFTRHETFGGRRECRRDAPTIARVYRTDITTKAPRCGVSRGM